MNASFHARDLKKTYNGREVVKNVSIDVERGEVVGLLGLMVQERQLPFI